jgi:hypothetical protein
MKVGNGTGTWNALSYIKPFSLTNITPLLGAPGFNGSSATASGWYRRLIPPANKIDQVEFYPTNILMDPSGTATSGGEVRVYSSSGVDNVGSQLTSSYPISLADWNSAAAAGTSIKATLIAPILANGTSGYVVGAHQLGGYGLGPSTTRLNNVTISASVSGVSNISWSSVTGGSLTSPTTFQRRVLYGTGIVSGTYLNYTSGLSGTITNVNYPTAVTVSNVMVIDLTVKAVLTGVTIGVSAAGSSSISWTGASTSSGANLSFFNGSGFLLSARGVNVGSNPNSPSTLTNGVSGSGTISVVIPYTTSVNINSIDIVDPSAGYKRSDDYVGVVVSSASSFTINSNVIITGTTASNGTYSIKSINTATNTLIIAAPPTIRPYIGSTGKAKPPGGTDVDIVSIYAPGTVKVTLASSVAGATVQIIAPGSGFDSPAGSSIVISGASSGNNVSSGYTTVTSTDGNSFTMVNLNAVSQGSGGQATISGVNGGNPVNIQSITPLAPMDIDPTRFFTSAYTGGTPVTSSRPRIFSWGPFINLYTTDTVSSSGSGVDVVSTATVTSALGQVSTVTSDNAVARVNGACDIQLPSKLRLLKRQGEEFSIYHKHLITGNWYNNGVIDYSSTASYGRQLNECVRFTGNELVTGTPLLTLTSTVRDYNWNVAKTTSTAVNVTDMTTNTAVRYLSIGDSITRRCQYQKQVMGLGFISSPISSIVVTGSPGSYTVTVNVTSTSGFKVGDSVSIVGATAPANDLTFQIATIESTTQFKFTATSGTPVTQGAAGGRAVVGAVASSRVTNCEISSGILTVTVGSNTNFAIGDSVTLLDISTRNNISARIESLVSSTGFTIEHEGGENSATLGSAITSKINTVGTRYDVYNPQLLIPGRPADIVSFSGLNTGFATEGRGGWAVSTFISNGGSASGFDSPFMFPTGLTGVQYRGNTEFWKRAIAVDSGGTCIVTVASRTGISVGTSITIAGANAANNVTKTVASLIGTNSFSIRNDAAVDQAAVGTVTPSGGSATDIQSIVAISIYDYDGFGRAAREGGANLYAYDSNGYPTAGLASGWRVYDPSKAVKFQQYNGTAWVDDSTAYTWAFDYSKYLARYSWAFPSNPTHVSVLLGANDYNSAEGTDPISFSSWITTYKVIVDSIRGVASPPKVIVLLPTMPTPQDGYGASYGLGVLAERARRNFQGASRALIDGFDTSAYESALVYVSLFGAAADPISGSSLASSSAPNKYVTDSSLFIRRSTDGVHPAPIAMAQAGDWLAATVQATR